MYCAIFVFYDNEYIFLYMVRGGIHTLHRLLIHSIKTHFTWRFRRLVLPRRPQGTLASCGIWNGWSIHQRCKLHFSSGQCVDPELLLHAHGHGLCGGLYHHSQSSAAPVLQNEPHIHLHLSGAQVRKENPPHRHCSVHGIPLPGGSRKIVRSYSGSLYLPASGIRSRHGRNGRICHNQLAVPRPSVPIYI